MQVLVGDTRSTALLAELKALGWGRMFAESHPTPWENEPWGFDNGAFAAWQRGQAFPEDRFLRRLDAAEGKALRPYLAVVPDKVAEGNWSLEFSLDWLPKLPSDWPWYLAVQDGMDPAEVERELGPFAGIFLGGTTRFKSTAATWRQMAHRNHRMFHFARAGTPNRIQHAAIVGADSLDSSFPLWTNERFREFVQMLTEPRSEVLPLVAAWMQTSGMYEFDPVTGCAP